VLTVVDHPLAAHHLVTLRDRTTDSARFRSAAKRLAYILVTEATSDIPTEPIDVVTPLETCMGARLGKPIVLVAVFRAGLGLIDAALDMIPDARIGYAGVQRDHDTAQPMEYYTKFPEMSDAKVLILEPMLATGGSLEWAVSKVKEHGATDVTAVCVVSAPIGVERMQEQHPDVRIVTAALDRDLDHNHYIRPGLGDLGDRLFGTA
jgi:uracil phosphoribosyltransferase